MSRLLWTLAWAAVAVWSLFALAAYGLVDLFGGLAARHADVVPGEPETVEWLSWFLRALRDLGTTLIAIVWGFISLCILAVPWMLTRILTPADQAGSAASSGGNLRRADGVIDLPSDQYTVIEENRSPRPAGRAPNRA